MDPFPSLNKVYSLMIQEETQRSTIHSSNPRVESTALVAKSQNFHANSRVNYVGNNGIMGKEKPVCTHCGKFGHTIDKCYKLHGFPPGYKFKGKTVMVHQVTLSQPQPQSQNLSFLTASGSMTPVFTPKQYQQLFALIRTPSSPLDTFVQGTNSLTNAMANVVTSNASSMAGMAFKHLVVSAQVVNRRAYNSSTCVIDTGATDHIVCSAHLLTSITAINQSMVQLPNGETASITYIGK